MPLYLFNLIPNFDRVHITKCIYNILPIKATHDFFKDSFLPSAILEWNKLDFNIRNSASLNTFKKKLLNFIPRCGNSIFDIHNPLTMKLLRRLRLRLSHKYRHWFQDTWKIFMRIWQRCWINNALLSPLHQLPHS